MGQRALPRDGADRTYVSFQSHAALFMGPTLFPHMLFTSRSCHRCVFSREGRVLCHEVFFRMYLPLALEVKNTLFIESLCLMVIDETHFRAQSVKMLAYIAGGSGGLNIGRGLGRPPIDSGRYILNG